MDSIPEETLGALRLLKFYLKLVISINYVLDKLNQKAFEKLNQKSFQKNVKNSLGYSKELSFFQCS